MNQSPSQLATSPLQLKSHFFPAVHVVSQPGGKKDAATSFSQDVGWSSVPGKSNEWQLQLGVKLGSADKMNPFLYEVDMQAICIVELVGNVAEERKLPIVVVNGLSLLYGAIREMVLNITARQAYGAISLPSVSFVDVLKLPEQGGQPEVKDSGAMPGAS